MYAVRFGNTYIFEPFFQEKRARFYVFHKALRHGVIIDFENLDDPTTKYLQFP
jgi:hypothetical protein